jgi:hypothetical protein
VDFPRTLTWSPVRWRRTALHRELYEIKGERAHRRPSSSRSAARSEPTRSRTTARYVIGPASRTDDGVGWRRRHARGARSRASRTGGPFSGTPGESALFAARERSFKSHAHDSRGRTFLSQVRKSSRLAWVVSSLCLDFSMASALDRVSRLSLPWLCMKPRDSRCRPVRTDRVSPPLGGAGRGWRHRTQPRHNCTPQLSLTAPASRISASWKTE